MFNVLNTVFLISDKLYSINKITGEGEPQSISNVPVVKHGKKLNEEKNSKGQQEHQTERFHIHEFSCRILMHRINLWDLYAYDVSADGLQDKRRNDPQKVQHEIQKHCLEGQNEMMCK